MKRHSVAAPCGLPLACVLPFVAGLLIFPPAAYRVAAHASNASPTSPYGASGLTMDARGSHVTGVEFVRDAGVEPAEPPDTVVGNGLIIYADSRAPGSVHDGLSWKTAYTNVQDALAKANHGDEIWVARGVYLPDVGTGQTRGDRTATFQLGLSSL